MKLLILSNNPARPSFRQRIGIYIDTLRTDGIDCHIETLPPGSLARRKLFRRAGAFDAVFLHKKRLNCWDAYWLGKYSRKIIYDFDDAVMYHPKHPHVDSRSRQKLFARTVKLADTVVAGNNYLAELARKFNPNVEILPTGLAVSDYQTEPHRENDNKIRLVWIGSKSTLPFLNSITESLEQIGRQYDNIFLRIIADDFLDLQNMPVEKIPWSLQGQYRALLSSDIGLAPLPDNRFTRGKCGFKILQYGAACLPVVASPVGVNAQYVQDGVTGFQAHQSSLWTEKIAFLVENASARRQMGLWAREMVLRYDSSLLAAKLSRIIKTL